MTRARAVLKGIVDAIAVVLLAPAAATAWLERAIAVEAEAVFSFWAHCVALVPGPPGIVARRAYYRLTLDACASSFYVGFGALFSHRSSIVEDGAYIGTYALVGSARLGPGCLIGSRASLLSGSQLHQLDEAGRWLPTDPSRRQQVQIGAFAWIGEGAIVMADVGDGAMVAAGAVVSAPVPPSVVVAGNPARFVRRLAVPLRNPDPAVEPTAR